MEEKQEFDPKKLSDKEKYECAKDIREMNSERLNIAERRCSELSDEFTRLEVQIATLLFAFIGIFLNSLSTKIGDGTKVLGDLFSASGLTMIKITLVFIVCFLILSLVFGLVHIKRKEEFWHEVMGKRNSRFIKWSEVVKKTKSFDEGQAFSEGTIPENSSSGGINSSPNWTWVMQTTSLSLAIMLIFTLLLVFLFH